MNVLKNKQKIWEANGMLDLPIVHTQVTLRGNVGSLDAPIHIWPLGGRVMHLEGHECSQKSAKNRGSQCYAQSAHCAHTGHFKAKCGFSLCSYSRTTIHICP